MKTWEIPGTVQGVFYIVEERRDTVKGGTYLFCPCAGWPFQRGKGNDCRHVAKVKMMIADATLRTGAPSPAPKAISKTVPDRAIRDPHKTGMCGIGQPHTSADHAAAVALGVA